MEQSVFPVYREAGRMCICVGFISSNAEVVQHFIMFEMVRLMGVLLVIASSASAAQC